MAASAACASPSLFRPRKNCGPVRKPMANRNSRKKHCLTSFGSVTPSCRQALREQRTGHGAELEAAERDLAEQVAEPEHRKTRSRMRLQDPCNQVMFTLRLVDRHARREALRRVGDTSYRAACKRSRGSRSDEDPDDAEGTRPRRHRRKSTAEQVGPAADQHRPQKLSIRPTTSDRRAEGSPAAPRL